MGDKPENPPAFPLGVPHMTEYQPEWGMSLRDWFAGQAMAGFLADGSQRLVAQAIEQDAPLGLFQDASAKASVINEQLAIGFYQLADAMLAQRLK